MNYKQATNAMFEEAIQQAKNRRGLTLEQIASRLSISKTTLWRMRNEGEVDFEVYTKLVSIASGKPHRSIIALLGDTFSALLKKPQG